MLWQKQFLSIKINTNKITKNWLQTTATLVTSQWFKKNLRISQKIVEGNPNNPVFVEDGSTWVSFLSSMVSYFRDNVNDYQITLSMENVQEILDVSSYIIGGKKVISYITQEERERWVGTVHQHIM